MRKRLLDVSLDIIQNLLDFQEKSFPEESIDLDQVIDEFMKPEWENGGDVSEEVFRYLVKYRISERISALGPRRYRDDMACKLEESFSFYVITPKEWFYSVMSKLSGYEKEFISLKEGTTMIELALWKYKMNESESKKKRKRTEESDDFREQCRFSCGAGVIIEHMLPFLIPDALSCESESDRCDGRSSSTDDNESSDGNESE